MQCNELVGTTTRLRQAHKPRERSAELRFGAIRGTETPLWKSALRFMDRLPRHCRRGAGVPTRSRWSKPELYRHSLRPGHSEVLRLRTAALRAQFSFRNRAPRTRPPEIPSRAPSLTLLAPLPAPVTRPPTRLATSPALLARDLTDRAAGSTQLTINPARHASDLKDRATHLESRPPHLTDMTTIPTALPISSTQHPPALRHHGFTRRGEGALMPT